MILALFFAAVFMALLVGQAVVAWRRGETVQAVLFYLLALVSLAFALYQVSAS